MLKRHLNIAVFLSTALVSLAASAGELTLFAGPGFQGRDLSLRAETRDLSQYDFNDRASSMVVRSGRWEVCVDANFRGRCEIYGEGEYPDLERMGNAITSAREIGGARGGYRSDNRDDNRGEHRGRGREGVELFALPDFGGARFSVRQDFRQLDDNTFDDQAASMIVYSGQWEFCQHPDFGGQCQVFGPGEYRNLDRSMVHQITSVRQVGQDRGRRDDRERRREGVELFSSEGFNGARFQVREDYRQLDRNNFDDRAESLIVYSGQWQFCQHPDFGGRCMTYGPGRYDRLGILRRQITSIRQVR